jgi:protocatechuate 3,4-dioxygenase beta subunit
VPDSDDAPIGRILSRREMLALLGGSGAALLAACAPGSVRATASPASAAGSSDPASGAAASAIVATPNCIVVPALTEGPYFVDEKLSRSDIRNDPTDGSVRPGTPLTLALNISRASGGACGVLTGATVDIWHCDALGVYSDASDPGFNTKGKKFLRGYQTTDSGGNVRFTTIYPGWYQGRAVHIHFKIRTPATNATYDFTSQFFFDDSFSDQVYAQAPYSQKGSGRLRNGGDSIYTGGGDKLLLPVTKSASGYAAAFAIGLAI